MPSRRRTWMKDSNGRRTYAEKGPLKYDDDKCYGYLDLGTGNIHIEDNLPEVMKQHKFHEDVHVAFLGIQHNDLVAIFGDCDDEELEAREEALAVYLTNKLYPHLSRPGWLRYPKPPKRFE